MPHGASAYNVRYASVHQQEKICAARETYHWIIRRPPFLNVPHGHRVKSLGSLSALASTVLD